jgi:hypothetical protein
VVLSPIVYEDSQRQSAEPIGPQEQIPAGVWNMELSWDRERGYMRVIINGKKYWFKEYLGKAVATGTDNARGRLNLRAMARLDGETLTMYRPPDAAPHPLVEGVERQATHNRLCYRRASRDWRLRDERRPEMEDALVFTQSYVGDLSAEWNGMDTVAHIYHNGYTIIDAANVAHLYDPDLSYG